LLLTSVWDLKAKELAHQTGQFEDIKPQFIQTIQALLDDVDVFIKALEHSELRWDNAHFCLQNLKESLPSAVDESMPLRPMHVLDPVYPQLPIEFDWGILPQGQDDNRQPTPASGASDISQWGSTSQMPIFPSTPYQQQSYSDATNQSHWLDQLYNDFPADRGNSTYIPFASFSDDWSSQPPPRIRGYSTHGDANTQLMDIRWSRRGSPQIDESTGGNWWQPFELDGNLDPWNGLSRDGNEYKPKGLDSRLTRGIYTTT